MGKSDNVSNIQHWNSLIDKARRSGWEDAWEYFSPVGYGLRSVDRKDWYIRVMNPTFLRALFGERLTSSGYVDDMGMGEPYMLPAYHVVGLEVADMMMRQDHESVLAWLDSLPVYNWKNEERPEPDTQEEDTGGAEPL